jgi:hypothetical protein
MIRANDKDSDPALDTKGTEVSCRCVEGKAGSKEGGSSHKMGSG